MSTLAKRILEEQTDGMRLFASRVSTKDVLTIEGSVLGGPTTLARGKGIIAGLITELLDAGTKKHSKEALRALLADKGISLSFSSSGERIYFSASALPEDYETVVNILAECLFHSLFTEKELVLLKERAAGELAESATDTRTQASIALSRTLYPKNHPNYADSIEETLFSLKKVTRKELVAHYSRLGKNGLIFVVVGDIQAQHALTTATRIFSKIPSGDIEIGRKHVDIPTIQPAEKTVPLADKANIDSYFGVSLDMTSISSDYYPLFVLVSMLAGRGLSTGHLMRTIRERDGLTYGIYGSLTGFDDFTTGFFRIWATFAPAVYKKAIVKVKEEIRTFLKTGITKEALATKKQEIRGTYQVSLSTSSGLAHTLHAIGKQGKPVSFIDTYPSLIEEITLHDINAVKNLLDPKNLSLAASGTFLK